MLLGYGYKWKCHTGNRARIRSSGCNTAGPKVLRQQWMEPKGVSVACRELLYV